MDAVQWSDPPPKNFTGSTTESARTWQGIRVTLQANPGRWALVRQGYKNSVCPLTADKAYETTSRVRYTDDGARVYDIWARWTP